MRVLMPDEQGRGASPSNIMTLEDLRHKALVLQRLLVAVPVAGLLVAVSILASDQPSGVPARLTYTKVMKGSVPEYLSITLNAKGEASYEGRKLNEPPEPYPLQLTEATTQRIFELAAALDYFQSDDLESHKKVANLGTKTFTYEADGRKNQVEFNYTRRRDAQELAAIFERIGGVARHIITLEYSIKYDRLMLPEQLRRIQVDLDKRALADPELMAPTLEKIVRNPRFLHLAKSRAEDILQRLQDNPN